MPCLENLGYPYNNKQDKVECVSKLVLARISTHRLSTRALTSTNNILQEAVITRNTER